MAITYTALKRLYDRIFIFEYTESTAFLLYHYFQVHILVVLSVTTSENKKGRTSSIWEDWNLSH